MIVKGYKFNKEWVEEFDIRTSNIKIKSKARGRTNVGYYLRICSFDQKDNVSINTSFKWKYKDLHIIFKKFKEIKAEKITLDEKFALDLIEKKDLGFTSFDILIGKEIKK